MTTPTDRDDGGSTVDAEERRNAWQAIEPDLRPFVDKTERPWSWRHDALERRRAACWRQWLAEPPTPLDGAACSRKPRLACTRSAERAPPERITYLRRPGPGR